MESTPSRRKPTSRLGRVIGLLLLIPPIVSVPFFVWYLLFPNSNFLKTDHLGNALICRTYSGEATLTAPIYLGLMAIAGAILLKKTDKK